MIVQNITTNKIYSGSKLTEFLNGTLISYNGAESYVGINAFKGCSSLEYINLPYCSSISDAAFAQCVALRSVYINECENIGSNAFQRCSLLQTLNAPGCITIGSSAFDYCNNLRNIYFLNCSFIGENAFRSCYALTELNFPECLSVEQNAFNYCSSVVSVSFPKCEHVGGFGYAIGLQSFTFPNCKSLIIDAFYGCTISFVDSTSFGNCLYIGQRAFCSCPNLTMVSFPSCTNIESSAFYNCPNLMSIYLMGSSVARLLRPAISIFRDSPILNSTYTGSFGSIYVPASLEASYKAATYWSNIKARIVGV